MFSLKTCAASVKNTRKITFLLILAISLLSMVLMGAMYDTQRKSVKIMILDDFSGVNMVKTATTRIGTVEELLKEERIGLEATDVVSHELDAKIADGDTITIRRGRNIILKHDGVSNSTITTKKKVSDVLESADIKVNQYDIVTPSLDSYIKDGDTISLVRVTHNEYSWQEEVQFSEVIVEDENMFAGERVVRQEGAAGLKEIIYAEEYHDGVRVPDVYVGEKIITPATDRIVAVGTKTAGTYKGFTYKRKLTVNASAYEPYNCGGDGRGITASGMKAQFGVVAVDPRVIPLGTKLYIESTDDGKSWTYGYAIAADTGGAIKGNKIDLCYNTRSECIQFGRRSATVYVLG